MNVKIAKTEMMNFILNEGGGTRRNKGKTLIKKQKWRV